MSVHDLQDSVKHESYRQETRGQVNHDKLWQAYLPCTIEKGLTGDSVQTEPQQQVRCSQDNSSALQLVQHTDPIVYPDCILFVLASEELHHVQLKIQNDQG